MSVYDRFIFSFVSRETISVTLDFYAWEIKMSDRNSGLELSGRFSDVKVDSGGIMFYILGLGDQYLFCDQRYRDSIKRFL